MTTYLTQDFVERKISVLKTLQDGWGVDRYKTGNFYRLDLKMCQIKDLSYSFEWGQERGIPPRLAKLTETPSKILYLDISLNELISLTSEGLLPFRNLRVLDASLNQIGNFQGIEVLPLLYSLNLSHNMVSNVQGLVNSGSLVELNLNMNKITDLSRMPSLINLKVLNLNNNHLATLDGVSALPKLQELYVQRNNLVSLVHVTSCFYLTVLNAAENKIHNLDGVTDVLPRLGNLQVLCLHGNPIDRENDYQHSLLSSSDNIMMLDNISVRPLARKQVPMRDPHSENISNLQEAARQAFDERIRATRSKVDENVSFLQKRIIALQDEQKDFEHKMKNDLDACLRYLGTLSNGEAAGVDRTSFSRGFPSARDDLQTGKSTARRNKNDYQGVKDTDEVLRCAYNELSTEKSSRWDDI
ncbi:hypothetical protein SNE40_008246 [Patella caerulea]|uniref:Uncharacterized protein n=1 Tax=Patella caerulea TaxID=87958 RepID=A0AAN8JYG5_PATCE